MSDPQDPAQPSQPARDWRDRDGARRAIDTGAVVWGAILIAVGTWFFLDQTLGLEMPDVAWGDLWPVLLLIVGGTVILQGLRRRPS
jgi:hypothetical protein